MIERLLKSWRKQIPAMSCEAGCRQCCEGYAPAMSRWEWRQIGHPGKYATGRAFQGCPFLEEGGCAIYHQRPLICRLFGTVERAEVAAEDLAATLPVFCPRGHIPETPLPLARALKIQVDYQAHGNRDLAQTVADWQKYSVLMGRASPPAEMPEKFEWLRYVLSTRDGQTTMRLIWGAAPQMDQEKMGRIAALIGD